MPDLADEAGPRSEHGHHRSPFLLSVTGIDEWLDPRGVVHEVALATPRIGATSPELTHSAEGALKGIDKGRAAAVAKRDKT